MVTARIRWAPRWLLVALVVAGCGGGDGGQFASGPLERPSDVTAHDDSSPSTPRGVRPEAPSDPEDASPPTDNSDAAETVDPLIRGTWIHLFDGTLKSRASIAATVDELAAAGVNTVIAQVARRHDAYYTSRVLPRTADPELEGGLDVLDELITRASAHDIAVHAWISVAPTWHGVYDDLPAPAGWVPALHGRSAPEADRWVTRSADGQWSTFLDPGVPAVHDHVAAIVTELARDYPVAGIHLDYVRYAGTNEGYHPVALERFRADTGRSGTPDPTDPEWMRWRRDQGTQIVRRARQAIDATGSDVQLSAAVITWGPGPEAAPDGTFGSTRASTQALQDWPNWVRAGLVDVLMPMNYFRAHDADQAAWFGQWLRFQAALTAETGVPVVPGVGGWLNRPAATEAQVAAAVTAAGGAVVYSYQQPTDDGSRDVWSRLAAADWYGDRYSPTG